MYGESGGGRGSAHRSRDRDNGDPSDDSSSDSSSDNEFSASDQSSLSEVSEHDGRKRRRHGGGDQPPRKAARRDRASVDGSSDSDSDAPGDQAREPWTERHRQTVVVTAVVPVMPKSASHRDVKDWSAQLLAAQSAGNV